MLRQRLEDFESVAGSLQRDRGLDDRSFLIRVHVPIIVSRAKRVTRKM
jgi:hypothetical protein